jgi:hypothetical protein
MASIRAGSIGVTKFWALPGNRAMGETKQYCYIQTMATGMPLCIPPHQETVAPDRATPFDAQQLRYATALNFLVEGAAAAGALLSMHGRLA